MLPHTPRVIVSLTPVGVEQPNESTNLRDRFVDAINGLSFSWRRDVARTLDPCRNVLLTYRLRKFMAMIELRSLVSTTMRGSINRET